MSSRIIKQSKYHKFKIIGSYIMQLSLMRPKVLLIAIFVMITWTTLYHFAIPSMERKNIDEYWANFEALRRNNSHPRLSSSNVTDIQLPTPYSILPHLSNHPDSLKPAFLLSKNQNRVGIVLGIPTVKRRVQNYLFATLKNLLDNMTPTEAVDSLIIVMIAEVDLAYVTSLGGKIEAEFPNEVANGLIEVISPSPHYYPDFTKLKDTLGDNHERVMWRSKQNLDFAFLMSYGQSRGSFYIQLEDDILARENFITAIKSFVLKKAEENRDWIVIEFCGLGFIGKLFKCEDLRRLIEYFLLFYTNQPVDWLLDLFIVTSVCPYGGGKECKNAKAKVWLHHKPSLFQHMGTYSSLKGKVQYIKDKEFGKLPLNYTHKNTKASMKTNIVHYQKYTLEKAYRGESFFWGLAPKSGDFIKFEFEQPIFIKKFLFTSGNSEHPEDKFFNTTIDVFPAVSNISVGNNNSHIIIGQFDEYGIAQGKVDKIYGKISELQLSVHSNSSNWVILSEIQIVADVAV